MDLFFQHVANGLVTGSIYALVALGVTLVYGLTRLVNFAHGELVTVGAFVAFLLVDSGLPFTIAIIGAIIGGGVLSLATERLGFRFTRAAPVNGFILSLGLIFVIQGALILLNGDTVRTIETPVTGEFTVAGVVISHQRIVVLALAAMLAASLAVYLKWSKLGRATRAYAEDPATTALMGVPTEMLIVGTFLLGGGLAAAAGALLLSLYSVTVMLGSAFVIKAFAVALIGGLGSVPGAVLGGLAVGLVETMGSAYVSSSWTDFFGYVLMIVILLIRPSGLFRGAAGAHL